MSNKKKTIHLDASNHEGLAIRAIKKHSTMEKELDIILKKEFKTTKKKDKKK